MTIKKNTEFSNKCELRGRSVTWNDMKFCVSDVMLKEELSELEQAINNKDYHEIIDGACDVAVIALNTCYKMFRLLGLDHQDATERTQKAFNIVCDSNLSKICKDGTIIIKDGKVKKPTTFVAPDFSELLNGLV